MIRGINGVPISQELLLLGRFRRLGPSVNELEKPKSKKEERYCYSSEYETVLSTF